MLEQFGVLIPQNQLFYKLEKMKERVAQKDGILRLNF